MVVCEVMSEKEYERRSADQAQLSAYWLISKLSHIPRHLERKLQQFQLLSHKLMLSKLRFTRINHAWKKLCYNTKYQAQMTSYITRLDLISLKRQPS